MADFNIAYKEKISSLKLNKKTQDIVGKNVFLGEPTIQINKGTYTENVSLQATFEISDTKMIITGCLITISEQESYSVLITKEAPVAAIVYEYGEENKIYMSGFESEESLPVNALLVGKIDFSDEGNLKEDFKYILTLSDLDTELKTYIKDIGLTEEASVPSDVSIQVTKGNGDKETINFPKATAQKDGLLSSEDKSKLDSIAEGANKYTHPNSGVTAGTYRSVSVNAQGHVTKGTNPTTLDGYGIKQVEAEKITGIIGLDNLPQGALERCVVVKNDEARFALTSDDVQIGDTVKVESTGLMYFIKDDTKLSSEEGYEVYTAGSATSVPWSGITGKPETFTPSEHTHTKDEITDFPDIDTTPTSDSDSLITSGGVYEALSDKADKNHTHPDATEEASGFMSAQDKMTMGMLPNYVVCDTASDVAVKDITLPGFDKKQEYPAFILYLKNGNTSGTVLKFRVNGADEITVQYNNDESNIVNLNSGWYVFTYAYGSSDRFDLLGAVSTTGISYHSDDDIFLNYGLVAVNTGALELHQGILYHHPGNGFRHIPSNGETGQILANAGTGSAKWQTPDSAPTSGSSNVVTSDGVYAAMQATEITGNTDLNNIENEGYYWCTSGNSNNVVNKPGDVTFFSLRVTKISDGVFSQELTTSGNRKFIRIQWSGTWTEWVRFATEEDISDIYFNIEYSGFVICTFESYSNNLFNINSEVDLKAGDKFLVQITGTNSYTTSSGFTMTIFINNKSGTVDDYEINDTDGTPIKSITRGKIAIFEVGSDNNVVLKGYLDKFPSKLTLPNSRPLIIKTGDTEVVYDGSYGVTIPVDTSVINGSHNIVSSDGVYTALDAKCRIYVKTESTPICYTTFTDGTMVSSLQSALTIINNQNTTSRYEIILLPGTHNLSYSISPSKEMVDLTIRGFNQSNRDNCIINFESKETSTNKAPIFIGAVNDNFSLTLKDFTIKTNNAKASCAYLSGCTSVDIDNVFFVGGNVSGESSSSYTYHGVIKFANLNSCYVKRINVSNCIFDNLNTGLYSYCVYIESAGEQRDPCLVRLHGNACITKNKNFDYYVVRSANCTIIDYLKSIQNKYSYVVASYNSDENMKQYADFVFAENGTNFSDLQTFIDNMPSGSIVRMLTGTYTFTDGLILNKTITIEGAGHSTAIQLPDNVDYGIIINNNPSGNISNVTLKNFSLATANNYTGDTAKLITIKNINGVYLYNLRFYWNSSRYDEGSSSSLITGLGYLKNIHIHDCVMNSTIESPADNSYTIDFSNASNANEMCVFISGCSYSSSSMFAIRIPDESWLNRLTLYGFTGSYHIYNTNNILIKTITNNILN